MKDSMKTLWLTVLNGEVERQHHSFAAAKLWAQCTHCTDSRPRREGQAYVLGRTMIVREKVWESWKGL